MKRILLLVALLLAASAALAQSLEIITLQHQTAEQVLPQLLPLLEPGGGLTGTGSKLFLRASPRNREDILRVLEVLDREPRRLLISVRQGAQADQQAQGGQISGDVGLGANVRIYQSGRQGAAGGGTVEIRRGDSVVRGRVYDSSSTGSDDVSQQVQVVEGGQAFIQVGRSVPVPVRQTVMTARGAVTTESVSYQDFGTGFYVQPRLSGNQVTLDISPSRETPGPVPGSANIQQLTTTVSGRLGEWISLGGSTRETREEQAGTLRYGTRSGRDERQVWLKVDELR